jgi:hypothetical protein
MDRHSFVLLDGIIKTICYYLSAMDTTTSVGVDFQLDGSSVCWWTDIIQEENGPDRTNYWLTGILSVENGPG